MHIVAAEEHRRVKGRQSVWHSSEDIISKTLFLALALCWYFSINFVSGVSTLKTHQAEHCLGMEGPQGI